MKKLLLIVLLIVGAYCQDELILLNGQSIKGEYVKTENEMIYFIPEGSKAPQKIKEDRIKHPYLFKDTNNITNYVVNEVFGAVLFVIITFIFAFSKL